MKATKKEIQRYKNLLFKKGYSWQCCSGSSDEDIIKIMQQNYPLILKRSRINRTPFISLQEGAEEWICNNCGNHFIVSTIERTLRIVKDQRCPICKKVDTGILASSVDKKIVDI